MKWVVAIGIGVFFLPGLALADIHVTEVAWMGTSASQYSEWIELYNDGASSVNLAGWKLYEGDGGALVFTFTKSIPSNGYLLLERTTASAPDAVPGINDEAGPFGGGGFANTGEDLVLKDSSGSTIEALNFIDGWPAGDAVTKQTMQWNNGEWITARATPKADADGSGGDDDDTEDAPPEEEVEGVDPFPIPKVSPNKPMVAFTVPSSVYRGVAYQFEAQPLLEYNFHVNEGELYWNMGDGTIIRQQTVAPIMHTYEYPGTYTLFYSYTDAFHKNGSITGTKKVRVVIPSIAIAIVGNTALEIKNTSGTPVDLSGWSVVAEGRQVAIPAMTIVAEKATVTIPLKAFGITSASSAAITDPSGTVVARTGDRTSDQTSTTTISYIRDEPAQETFIESPSLIAEAVGATGETTPIRNRTKTFIFGAVALFVIVLSILLERFMARQEYSEEA